MEHTKGKWEYRVSKGNDIQVIIPKGVILTLGHIYSDDCGVTSCCKTEEHANAKLIASAPLLLEALQTVNRALVFGANPNDKGLIEIMETAIKQATE